MNLLDRIKIKILLKAIEKDGISRWIVRKEAIKMVEKVRIMLAGYKTYIGGIAAIVGAISAWINGAIPNEKAIEVIWEALMLMFVRAGVSKAGK